MSDKPPTVLGAIQGNNSVTSDIVTLSPSPCSVECPLGTNVKAYVSLVAAGRFDEALEVARDTNPFAGICGRVCPHPCETACTRNDLDESVSIAALKRFLSDYELRRGIIPRFKKEGGSKGTVAIVGSGPAGLTCASDLAGKGYSVTVFESQPVPGGMLAIGIPAYRLPRDILKIEIDAIKSRGVDIKLNTAVGRDITLEDLQKKFDALFIAVGAQIATGLWLPEEKEITDGFVKWSDFLCKAGLNKGEKPGDNVVVVGGGNTAVDSARTALRLGSEKVTILYRRTKDQMPAFEEEIEDALEEGIDIKFLSAPVKLLHSDGKLTGITCIKMELGEKDASGRPRPVPVKGSEFTVSCDSVIPAVGQDVDTSFISGNCNVALSERKRIQVNPDTLQTSCEGIFAGGDAVSGPSSVVEAIAAGHIAAHSIDRYLNDLPLGEPELIKTDNEYTVKPVLEIKQERIHFDRMEAAQRRTTFEEINEVYSESEAMEEAARCERCGPCSECTSCVGVCEKKQVIAVPEADISEVNLTSPVQLLRLSHELHAAVAGKDKVPVTIQNKPNRVYAFTSQVDEELCRGCGVCEETCGYHAIRVSYKKDNTFIASVDENMCRGCGTCVSVCPTGALDQAYFASENINATVQTMIQKNEKGVVLLGCYWNQVNSKESQNISQKIMTIMCSGRIKTGDVLKAFESGASKVLTLCCGKDTCHYGFGCSVAKENFSKVYALLSLLGIDEKRFSVIRDKKDFLEEVNNCY